LEHDSGIGGRSPQWHIACYLCLFYVLCGIVVYLSVNRRRASSRDIRILDANFISAREAREWLRTAAVRPERSGRYGHGQEPSKRPGGNPQSLPRDEIDHQPRHGWDIGDLTSPMEQKRADLRDVVTRPASAHRGPLRTIEEYSNSYSPSRWSRSSGCDTTATRWSSASSAAAGRRSEQSGFTHTERVAVQAASRDGAACDRRRGRRGTAKQKDILDAELLAMAANCAS